MFWARGLAVGFRVVEVGICDLRYEYGFTIWGLGLGIEFDLSGGCKRVTDQELGFGIFRVKGNNGLDPFEGYIFRLKLRF